MYDATRAIAGAQAVPLPDGTSTIIGKCWSPNPLHRPEWQQLERVPKTFEKLLRSFKPAHDLGILASNLMVAGAVSRYVRCRVASLRVVPSQSP